MHCIKNNHFILTLLFGLLVIRANSQGLINNGALITFSGASQLYIDGTAGNYLSQSNGSITPSSTSSITLEGNWTNNSTNVAFTTDGGGVVLAGAAQTINGTNATAFYNLTLAGTGVKTLAVNSTTVGGQATFTGLLAVGSLTMDLNSNRLDITNSATGAITSNSDGYIISETNTAVNPSIIRWYMRTTAGPHVYPFGVAGSKIPFTFNVTAAMANAAAYVDVSTRSTGSNNQPWAGASNVGAVSHMYSPNMPYADGTIPAVVDRWWDITNSHAVTADATFSYRGSENTLNALYSPGIVGAQYWNGSGWLPDNLVIGSGILVNTGVGSVTASGLNTFCPWVLSAILSPLPIELTSFEGRCVNNETVLQWCTASEKNNSYFTIEQSTDGKNYNPIGIVQGNGTTNEQHCYTFKTASGISALNYFRLVQTDDNNKSSVQKAITVEACQTGKDNIILTNTGTKQIGVLVNASANGHYQLLVHNTLGQIVDVKNLDIKQGFNQLMIDLDNVSNAVYYISVNNGEQQLSTKKILVSDAFNH